MTLPMQMLCRSVPLLKAALVLSEVGVLAITAVMLEARQEQPARELALLALSLLTTLVAAALDALGLRRVLSMLASVRQSTLRHITRSFSTRTRSRDSSLGGHRSLSTQLSRRSTRPQTLSGQGQGKAGRQAKTAMDTKHVVVLQSNDSSSSSSSDESPEHRREALSLASARPQSIESPSSPFGAALRELWPQLSMLAAARPRRGAAIAPALSLSARMPAVPPAQSI